MEFIDERIALLEKRGRELEREEQKEKNKTEGAKEPELTLEEARQGLKVGQLEAGGKQLFFEVKDYGEGKLPWHTIRDFYQETTEEDAEGNQVIILTGLSENINIYLTLLTESIQLKPMAQRKQEMEDTFKDLGMYAELLKDAELNKLDYLCFNTPTGKGTVYNITFWLHNGEQMVVGNLGCMETDRKIFGILLEAMVLELNEML